MSIQDALQALRRDGMFGDAAWLYALRDTCLGVLGFTPDNGSTTVVAAAFKHHGQNVAHAVELLPEERADATHRTGVPVRVICFVHAAAQDSATQEIHLHPAVHAWLQRCTSALVTAHAAENDIPKAQCVAVCTVRRGDANVVASTPPLEVDTRDAVDNTQRAQSSTSATISGLIVRQAQAGTPLGVAVHADDRTLHGALPLEWSEECGHLPMGYVCV